MGVKGGARPTVENIQNTFVHEAGGHLYRDLDNERDLTVKGVLKSYLGL